jgi:tRNA-dihydrouridine synthase
LINKIIAGNGDILSYEDYNIKLKQSSVAGTMIAR